MRIEQHNTMRCFVAKLKEIGCSSGDGKYLLKCEKIFAGALMDTRQFGLHINSHKDLHSVREILLIYQVQSSLLYKHNHFCSYIDGMPKTRRNQGGMQVSFGRHFGSKKVYLQCWNKTSQELRMLSRSLSDCNH